MLLHRKWLNQSLTEPGQPDGGKVARVGQSQLTLTVTRRAGMALSVDVAYMWGIVISSFLYGELGSSILRAVGGRDVSPAARTLDLGSPYPQASTSSCSASLSTSSSSPFNLLTARVASPSTASLSASPCSCASPALWYVSPSPSRAHI